MEAILTRRHSQGSFVTRGHFGERKERVREVRWRRWCIAGRYLAEMRTRSLRARGYRSLLEENTEGSLELPVCRLQQLFRLLPGTTCGQHELIDHHLLAKGVHFFVTFSREGRKYRKGTSTRARHEHGTAFRAVGL